MSFRREKYVPKGGPDGGDGGKGGDVVIVADRSLNTLLDHQYQQLYRAKNGAPGMGKNKHGAYADDLIIKAPVGTVIIDADTGERVADMVEDGQSEVVARGGRGGRGNARFATSRNQAPRRFEEGAPGEERELKLELKLMADVGLVGMPNAGKSTLISVVSNAAPKIADYPFTTRTPLLGVVRLDQTTSFVMADIPGLIENSSKGAGMGRRFLKHVERTRILLHLIDPSPYLEPAPLERFDLLMAELGAYDEDLIKRPMLAVITKLDIPENRDPGEALKEELEKRGYPVHQISSVAREGLNDLIYATASMLEKRGDRHV
jgi:GTP-binding protein